MEDDETLEPKAKLKPFEARRLGGWGKETIPKASGNDLYFRNSLRA